MRFIVANDGKQHTDMTAGCFCVLCTPLVSVNVYPVMVPPVLAPVTVSPMSLLGPVTVRATKER